MSDHLTQLYADRRAARDALADLPSGTIVRLPRRGTVHAGTLSHGSRTAPDGTTYPLVAVRWRNVRRNQYRTLLPRDLAQLEVKRGNRFEPWQPPHHTT